MDFQKIERVYREVSYYQRHKDLTELEWQFALRRQYADNHIFEVENIGSHPIYSDYRVHSPDSDNVYKVSIRDFHYDMNFCSCFDYKTNELGTCKHIEAVVLKLKESPKYETFRQVGFESVYTSVFLDYKGGRNIRIRFGTQNETAMRTLASGFFDANNTLIDGKYEAFNSFIDSALLLDPAFRCYADALAYIIDIRQRNIRQQALQQIHNDLPALVRAKLFPYQIEGVAFAFKAGRSLIADDMGLGKTLQAIAVAELLKAHSNITSVLIICPTSLKYQWKSEIERFSNATVRIVEGQPLQREQQYKGTEFYKIVSYHAVGNDLLLINNISADLVILDEAQRIKNFKAKISKAVKKIVAPYAIALTGTPIENKLEELYSIVQFVNPFKLGPFHKFLTEHQIRDERGKIVGYKELNNIGHLLADVMIRRKKSEVLPQLPERMDTNLFVPMTEEQMRMHDAYKILIAQLIDKWKRFGFLNEKERQRLLMLLHTMRMVCNSTYLVDQQTRHDTKIAELLNIVTEVMNQGDEKIVIFSQWERMTRIIADELQTLGMKFLYLHGSVPAAERSLLLKTFSTESAYRIFLSTDAGSVGLNLQQASYLINMDIPWNPAILEQRIARIFRIGQTQKISVINFISAGTIEQRMLDVLKFKSKMSEGVLDGGDDTIFMGESRFNIFMESVHDVLNTSALEQLTPTVDDAEEAAHISDDKSLFSPAEATQLLLFDELATVAPSSLPHDDDDAEDVLDAHVLKQVKQLTSLLSNILADNEKRDKILKKLIQKDEHGHAYLKIPLKDNEEAESILKGLSMILEKLG